MTLADMRSQGRKSHFPLLEIISIIFLMISSSLFALEFIQYRNHQTSGGRADVIIAGVQVGGLTEKEQVDRLNAVYLEQPLHLQLNGNLILLYPSEVGFTLDTDAMLAEVRQLSADNDSEWVNFWQYLRHESDSALSVSLQASHSQEKLAEYLLNLATRYDAVQQAPGFDPVTVTFTSGATSGTSRLDLEQAYEVVVAALLEPDSTQRMITLPTLPVSGTQFATMDTLRTALIQYMELNGIEYNTNQMVVSMYVLDLKTGAEMGLQESVPMSAVSTIKVPLLISYFRHKLTEPPNDEKYLLEAAIICSTNSAANEIMRITSFASNMNSYAEGARLLNQTMCEIGAVNTRLQSALFNGSREQLQNVGFDPTLYYAQAPVTTCEAGTGPTLDTSTPLAYNDGTPGKVNVDNLNRTTAADMGNVLSLIYQCAEDAGGLRIIYPDEITPTECHYMMEILRGTHFGRFSELGTPEGTVIHHKVGYGGEWNGDVAIIRSPATDYVQVLYVWQYVADPNGASSLLTWDLMADLSRVVYNYFNPTAPLTETREPLNSLGGLACVMPGATTDINLSDIDEGRFDENGNPISSACYDFGNPGGCQPFDNWGQTPQ